MWTLSVSFGLRPRDLMTAIEQARRVLVLASPLYIVLIGMMVATTLSALYLLTRRAQIVRGNMFALGGPKINDLFRSKFQCLFKQS